MRTRFGFLSAIFWSLLLYSTATAQEVADLKQLIKIDGVKFKKNIIGVNMLADVEFVKPMQISYGLSVFGAYRFFYKPKFNKGTSEYNPKVIERELFIRPTFGYIYRKRYNTSIFFIPELTYRHTFNVGIFSEVSMDIGYLYSKLNAPVYERQADGTFNKVSFGYHNMLLGGKVNLGYDFSKRTDAPIDIHFGSALLYRYPNNGKWVRRLIFEVGLSYVFRKKLE